MTLRHTGVDYLYPLRQLFFVNNYDLPIEGALWFLTAMFFSELIYFSLNKYNKGNQQLISVLTICIVIIGHCICSFLPCRLPWSLDAAFIGVGLIHIGSLIKRNSILDRIISCPLWLVVLSTVSIALLIFVNGSVNMNGAKYSCVPLFWINAVGSTLCGLNLSCKFYGRCGNCKIARIVTDIGRNSIVFLCCNHLTILVVGRGLGLAGINRPWIVATTAILFLWVFSRIIEEKKLVALFGK